MEKKIVICSLLIIGSLIAAQSSFAQEEKGLSEGISITVYNQNFGVVKERRTLELKEGVNDISFQDVAAGIDPTSVHFQ